MRVADSSGQARRRSASGIVAVELRAKAGEQLAQIFFHKKILNFKEF